MNTPLNRLIGVALCLGLLCGCTSMTELRLRDQRLKAQDAFRNGDYALAASYYESLADSYPHTARRERMRINQGVSLYTIGAYHDARAVFSDYKREFPSGSYTVDANDYLKKIDVYLSPNNPVKQDQLEAAKSDLNQLTQMLMTHPNSAPIRYAIGNIYYELGNYDEAVRYYYQALELDATYQEKTLVKERMILDKDGVPVPITPQMQKERNLEENPLVIFDTHDYTARQHEEVKGGPARFYNVTGKIRNQSSRLLRNVRIEVRFMNSNLHVLDVQTIKIGTMAPNTIRAFLAKADNYDNIYNITQYECVWTYDE